MTYRSDQSTAMPPAIVSTVFCRHQAMTPATSAATSLALLTSMRKSPGDVKTTAGTTITVSIATGTCLSASASSGGMSRRANKAMNDSLAEYVIAPTAKVSSQIVCSLFMCGHNLVTEHARTDRDQAAANQRQPQRNRIERNHRDRRDYKHQHGDTVAQQWHQHREEAQRHDKIELPRGGDDLPRNDAHQRGDLPGYPQASAAAKKIRCVAAYVIRCSEALQRRRKRLIS